MFIHYMLEDEFKSPYIGGDRTQYRYDAFYADDFILNFV